MLAVNQRLVVTKRLLWSRYGAKNNVFTCECNRVHLNGVEDALYVLGGKWKLRIIIALTSGYTRFNELQRTIKGISARVLSNELKQLKLNGPVKRQGMRSKHPWLWNIPHGIRGLAQGRSCRIGRLGTKTQKKIVAQG